MYNHSPRLTQAGQPSENGHSEYQRKLVMIRHASSYISRGLAVQTDDIIWPRAKQQRSASTYKSTVCIGVARILPGVHFLSNKLTTFFSRRTQKTA